MVRSERAQLERSGSMALDRKTAQLILGSTTMGRHDGVVEEREGWLDHLWGIVKALDIDAGQREGLIRAIYFYGACVDSELRSDVEGVAAGDIGYARA
jgi:hypothetical protein